MNNFAAVNIGSGKTCNLFCVNSNVLTCNEPGNYVVFVLFGFRFLRACLTLAVFVVLPFELSRLLRCILVKVVSEIKHVIT